MGSLLQNISVNELLTAFFSLLGAFAAAYFGYQANRQKLLNDSKAATQQQAKSAEESFRDDLTEQLKEAHSRLDRQLQRFDEREKRITELVQQIDLFWTEKAELKSRIATLEAELVAANRKIKELTSELEKFERKVFYIAPKEGAS